MKPAAIAARIILLLALLVLLFRGQWVVPLFAPFADNGAPVLYDRASLLDLALAHLGLVAVASMASALLAVCAGIFVTRPAGAEFLPVARSVVNIGQVFPPVAVLALAVPALGFGVKPVLVALVLYGLLPIFESALAGFSSISSTTLEAARAMGMNAWQRFFNIELPLALPVILNGLRLAVVINFGTATIGSTVAAKSLGDVIIAGLQTSNTAFVLQGGLAVALLAIVVYDLMGQVARVFAPQTPRAH